MAARIKLDNWRKGDTVDVISFEILKNGAALDLTGAFIRCIFRRDNASSPVALQIDSETPGEDNDFFGGITIDTPLDGKFSFDKISTVNFVSGNYVFDVEITLDNDDIITPVEGLVFVEQDITY